MKITNYHIKTSSGSVNPWGDQLNFLTEDEKKEFDNIGYSGKNLKGEKSSYSTFLNSLNKGTFQIDQTKYDNGDFQESFLITRVEL